jgi:predicted porin
VLAAGTGLGATAPLTRANNSIHYYSPVVNGFMLHAMVAAAEGRITGAVENSKLYGLRLGYANNVVDVRAAMIEIRNTALPGAPTFKDFAFGALYKFTEVSVGIHHRQQRVNAEKLAIWTGNVQVPVGAHNFKAQYQSMNQSGARSLNDASMIGLGYEYNLSKRTALYASFGRVDNEGAGTIAISGGPAVTATTFGGKKSAGYEAGLRHSF